MSAKIRVRPRSSLIARYRLVLLAVWTAVICAELIWNVSLVRENTTENARIQAQTTLEKDIVYRRWNASHGGVYAPVDETTRPNPYLVGVREREIFTPSRKELTLINPAYMTRQVYDLAPKESGVFGHITSLNPVRPGNAADPWEAAALRAFEGGGESGTPSNPWEARTICGLSAPSSPRPAAFSVTRSRGTKWARSGAGSAWLSRWRPSWRRRGG
jgi:hypothetical protein